MSERMIDTMDVESYMGPGSLCWIDRFGFAEHLPDGMRVRTCRQIRTGEILSSGWKVAGQAVFCPDFGWLISIVKKGCTVSIPAQRIRIEGRSSK